MVDDSRGRRRLAAVVALLGLVAAVVAGVVSLSQGSLGRLVVVAVVLVVAVVGLWYVVASRGAARLAGGVVALVAVAVLVLVVLTGPHNGWAFELSLVLVAVSAVAANYALGRSVESGEQAESDTRTRVASAQHPVLIMNRWSGGGKVDKFNLVEECTRRGHRAGGARAWRRSAGVGEGRHRAWSGCDRHGWRRRVTGIGGLRGVPT